MNVERIRQLAEHLRKPETAEHFDMNNWIRNNGRSLVGLSAGEAVQHCGTVACIAGHAAALFAADTSAVSAGIDHVGALALGLDVDNAWKLFEPHGESLANGDRAWGATNLQAAAVLDHLAETGEVDWSVAQ